MICTLHVDLTFFVNHTPSSGRFSPATCHEGFIPSHLWLCPSTVSGVYTSDLSGGHGKAVAFWKGGTVTMIVRTE